MADSRFFRNAGRLTLSEIIEIAGAVPSGKPDLARRFADVASLTDAGPDDVSFLDNRKYVDAFSGTAAGAAFVRPEYAEQAPEGCVALVSDDPYRSYALAAAAFYPETETPPGVSPGAHVDPSVKIGSGVHIAAGAVIGSGVRLGDGVVVRPNAVIADNVAIGPRSDIGPGVSLSHCEIGARVLIHAGARIGQRGFGFAMGKDGHLKVPQLGRVIVGDDVEIGANTTIDRGSGPDTVIGPGCMIDNLVQIGHNVQLGRGCVIVAQAGVAGSTKLGDFVVVAAQGGLTGHLTIGPGARVAAQAGVMRDVGPGETVGGSPAMDQRDWLRSAAILRRMAQGKDR